MEIKVNLTGPPSDAEKRGMVWQIEKQNAAIEAENVERASQDPPLDPLPLIAYETNVELRDAIEPLMKTIGEQKLLSLTSQADGEVLAQINSLIGEIDDADMGDLLNVIQRLKARKDARNNG